MSGWDLGVYVAAILLITAPPALFACYLRELVRRVKKDDWFRAPD